MTSYIRLVVIRGSEVFRLFKVFKMFKRCELRDSNLQDGLGLQCDSTGLAVLVLIFGTDAKTSFFL